MDDEQTDGCDDGWMDGQTDVLTDRQMENWTLIWHPAKANATKMKTTTRNP